MLEQQDHSIEIHGEVWRIADDAGFDSLWLYDHLVALGPDITKPVFDGWTALAAAASQTERVRLGLNVTGNLYRDPRHLAKIAVTVDHLSGGRLEFAIGTGWREEEFEMYGLPFPAAGERVDRLDEALRVMKMLWTQPRSTYAGRFYSLKDAVAEPKPVQVPHPPIWVGGTRPRMLRLTARHADVWHAQTLKRDVFVSLSRDIDTECVRTGRDPQTLRRSASVVLGASDETIAQVVALVSAGATDVIVIVGGPYGPAGDPRRNAEHAAALLPKIRGAIA